MATEGYLEGSGRQLLMLQGINLFFEQPIFGVGFGRFQLDGEFGLYPHNMIVELFSEIGIIGFVIVVAIITNNFIRIKRNSLTILFIFIVLFIRSMASYDLSTNIIVFALLFAVPSSQNAFTQATSASSHLS